jgi:subtilisin family serine protease
VRRAGTPRSGGPTAGDAVPLLVGLRRGADQDAPVERLEARTDIEVTDPEPVTGINAVTVDVSGRDQAAALAALRRDPAVAYVEVNHEVRATDVTVNDPRSGSQWGLRDTRVPAAWDRTIGSADITVAVVDSGVSAVSELTGALVGGYDFVNNDANPADDDGHGTAVASGIAAGGNDGSGFAGICWTCRIMPVKVLDSSGGGNVGNVAAGITWAADHGAKIINLSLGGAGDSIAVRNAVDHAIRRGALVVAAAGNEGSTAYSYPAAIPEVLAVGWADGGGNRNPDSNHGAWVDVAAPGCNMAQLANGAIVDGFCGTSAASPVVAGIAALVLAATPAATAADLTRAITSTAVPVPGGWVERGRVDAAAAVAALPGGASPDPSVRATHPGAGSQLRGYPGFSAVTSPDVVSVQLVVDGAVVATDTDAPWRLWWNTGGRNGAVTVNLRATDADGHSTTVGMPITLDNAAPRVSFRSPAVRAAVRAVVRVTPEVSDNVAVGRVELLAGGRVVATDWSAPWSLGWLSGRTNSAVTLGLRAYDRAGNVSSATRVVIVDNTRPAVSITKGPRNQARVSGTVRLTVGAKDRNGIDQVQVIVNGRVVARDTRAPYTFGIKVAKYGRKLTVKVRGYDRAGNVRYVATRVWRR